MRLAVRLRGLARLRLDFSLLCLDDLLAAIDTRTLVFDTMRVYRADFVIREVRLVVIRRQNEVLAYTINSVVFSSPKGQKLFHRSFLLKIRFRQEAN